MLKHAIPLKELYNVRAESFLQNTGNQRFWKPWSLLMFILFTVVTYYLSKPE